MAPNQEEDVKDGDKPSNKTAEDSTPSVEDSKQKKVDTEQDVDYKVKFSESTRENQRILDENKKLKEQTAQAEDVMGVLYENPDILKTVQSAYDRKYGVTPTSDEQSTGVVANKVLEAKVQEKISPVTKELQEIRQQQVSTAVQEFSKLHPDATEGTETWQKVINLLPAMKAQNLPLHEGLEMAYDIVKLKEAKKSGKPEILEDLFAKNQAAAGGGSAAGASNSPSEVSLTPEEKKVADKMHVSYKDYAKNKKK
jgi:hypothetical protein